MGPWAYTSTFASAPAPETGPATIAIGPLQVDLAGALWHDRAEVSLDVSWVSARRFADVLLFGVTSVELALLLHLTPTFAITDWIYVSQHLVVLGIALLRRAPSAQDHSLLASAAVIVSYAYPYAQIAYLRWVPGDAAWPAGGFVLIVLGACLSLASLLTLGRRFGVRPAARGLATTGPYRLVRHPLYLAYVLADIGCNLEEWNSGTVLLVIVGWVSLVYRIYAEERILAGDIGWPNYRALVRSRLLPGLW